MTRNQSNEREKEREKNRKIEKGDKGEHQEMKDTLHCEVNDGYNE
jgi:hypothetical protein